MDGHSLTHSLSGGWTRMSPEIESDFSTYSATRPHISRKPESFAHPSNWPPNTAFKLKIRMGFWFYSCPQKSFICRCEWVFIDIFRSALSYWNTKMFYCIYKTPIAIGYWYKAYAHLWSTTFLFTEKWMLNQKTYFIKPSGIV